jgi:Ca2+-transporting ATPase
MALQQTPQSAPNTTATATTAATRKSVATLQKLERIDYNATSTDAGSLSMDQLVLALCIDPAALEQHRGLTETQVAARSAQYGPNALRAKPRTSVWLLIAEQFQDRLVQILLAVAVLSAVFGVLQHNGGTAAAVESESILKALVEPSVILAILVLNAATGVWQSMSANDSLVALQKMQADVCRVARNDKLLEIPAAELVPGDVLLVQVGDKIAADARLLSLEQSLSLKVDQGSLTGESVTVGKLPGDDGTVAANSPVQDQKGMLFAGTMVTAGRGKAVVVQTGMDTQFGKIQAGVTEAAATQVKTPLAIKLDDFGEQLTLIIGVICLAVWIVSIPKMNDPSFANVWQGGIYYAKVAVALGVAAIPEGLPAVITLCLSLGTRRMAERNVIVRKLPSVETLGCVTVICTDKTGTLTQNGTYRKLVD